MFLDWDLTHPCRAEIRSRRYVTKIWTDRMKFIPPSHVKELSSTLFDRYNSTSVKMSARTDAEAEQNQMNSGVTPETLESTLREKLDASHVDIADLSGTI